MYCHYGPEIPYHSPKSAAPPKSPVVLLGAGASAGVGCPLVRGFVSRGRDLIESDHDYSSGRTLRDALDIYEDFEKRFLRTEEDLENIEALISIADLEEITADRLDMEHARSNARILRDFVSIVISQSSHLPDSRSNRWIGKDDSLFAHQQLIIDLVTTHSRPVIVSLNYDCVIEWACHCLGVPFTYDPEEIGQAVLILKLHGSLNWATCNNQDCISRSGPTAVEPHTATVPIYHLGSHIEALSGTCPECSQARSPVIVPPSWAKQYKNRRVLEAWQAARRLLKDADVLIAIGYSLPEADAAVRHLLHVGLAGNAIQEVVCIVGPDDAAARRWRSLFRSSWAANRLSIYQNTLAECAHGVINRLLTGGKQHGWEVWVPPIPFDEDRVSEQKKKRAALDAFMIPNYGETYWKKDWTNAIKGLREGNEGDIQQSFRKAGFEWYPPSEAMPVGL